MDIQSLFTPEILISLEIGIIGAIFLFLMISRNFTLGIYTWLLTMLFFKYQKLDFAASLLPNISIDRVLFVFLIGIFILEILSKRRRAFSPTGIEYSMLAFVFLALVSLLWSGSIVKRDGGLALGNLLTGYVFPFSMFFISQHVYDSPENRKGFIKFVIFIGLYLSLTAIFEHFDIDALIWPRYIKDPHLGIHFGRARGPFVQAAVNGTALGFVLPAAFYFLLNSSCRRTWRYLSYLSLVLAPLAVFFTYTRASWIGAFMGIAIVLIFVMRHNRKMFIGMVIVLCLLVVLSFSFLNDNTITLAANRAANEGPIYDRLNLYAASMNMFAHSPLFGVGFGRFAERVPDYFKNLDGIPLMHYRGLSEHDTFVGILTEMGIAGIIPILCIYLFILLGSIRLYRYLALRDSEKRSFVVIFWAFMGTYIINSMFIEMKYFGFVNSLFFIFAGIICGWERGLERQGC